MTQNKKALCFNCGVNVLETLEKEFNLSCSSGPPKEVWFMCPKCSTTLFFKVDTAYVMSDFSPKIPNTYLDDDIIGFIPSTDSYDYTIILDVVSQFDIVKNHSWIKDNLDLDTHLANAGVYENLDILKDPEEKCSYWYFKSKRDASEFVKRLNYFLNTLTVLK